MYYTTEQQAEHRRMWVGALRSNRFQQTRSRLTAIEPKVFDDHGAPVHYKRVGHCCLAVAVEVAIETGCPNIRVSKNGSDYEYAIPVSELDHDEMVYDHDDTVVIGGVLHGWVDHGEGNLPAAVADWLGTDQEGSLNEEGRNNLMAMNHRSGNLIDVNDHLRWDFHQIADLVDRGMVHTE